MWREIQDPSPGGRGGTEGWARPGRRRAAVETEREAPMKFREEGCAGSEARDDSGPEQLWPKSPCGRGCRCGCGSGTGDTLAGARSGAALRRLRDGLGDAGSPREVAREHGDFPRQPGRAGGQVRIPALPFTSSVNLGTLNNLRKRHLRVRSGDNTQKLVIASSL